MGRVGGWSLGSEGSLFGAMLAFLEKRYIEKHIHMTTVFIIYKLQKGKFSKIFAGR